MTTCEDCPMNVGCPSAGPKDADILIIGEAPGYTELRKGVPFTGISGKVLDSLLKENDIKRSRCRITNVVLCRDGKDVKPDKERLEACRPRLQAEIENEHVKTIICLGAYAAKTILGGSASVTKSRIGPPKKIRGKQVIVTYHPAAALRVPDQFPHIVNDFKKINGVVSYWNEPDWSYTEDTQEAIAWINRILNMTDKIAVDIETTVDKDEDYAHSSRILCIGIAVSDQRVFVLGHDSLYDTTGGLNRGIARALEYLLQNTEVTYQNGKFDSGVLWALGIIPRVRVDNDTMLMKYSMDERNQGAYGLDALGQEELGTPNWKVVLKPYKGDFEKVPRKVLYEYNSYDCAVTASLESKWLKDPEFDSRAQRLHKFLCGASERLAYLEHRGVKVDRHMLNVLKLKMQRETLAIENELKPWVENPRSPQQVTKALAAMGIETETTDADFLKSQVGDSSLNEPEVSVFSRKMLEHRSLSKLIGTYVTGIEKRLTNEDLLHPTYTLHSTVTGRTSCRNPNLQNIPRGTKIRSMFVSESGHTFVHVDYAGIEFRIVAHLAQDKNMIQMFRDGRDIHGELAQEIFGPGYDKEQRVIAKTVVHGANYGRTEHGIAEGLGIPVKRAKEILDTYMDMFPNIRKWQTSIINKVFHEDGTLYTPFGRRRTYPLITNDNAKDIKNEALAFIPQSVASDITLNAMMALVDEDFDVRLFIHDAVVVQVRRAEVLEVEAYIKRRFEEVAAEVYTDEVPFTADVSSGVNWGVL